MPINSSILLTSMDERGVMTLTLNRPDAFNAMSEALLEALQASITQMSEDPNLRVVVIQANGKAFCAGHDLKEMRAQPSDAYYRDLFARCSQVMMGLQNLPVPVIAKVHGLATAAGCQLVAQCDLAVSSDNATFAVSGVNVGLFCATPSVALTRNLSRKAAFEMLATGAFISAAQAVDKGLLNYAVSLDELDNKVAEMVNTILQKPRVALAMGKALFYRQLESSMVTAYEDATTTMACNMMDACALEGVQAFIDKRKPNW
ncbi:putative enoyl-CoA hydratase echA8 [Betaproteobacteria bacterium MOLA814]|nr:putative enoyl-CoA hydratase echA8 [Betaproteobacteria bacterium MOLA814]